MFIYLYCYNINWPGVDLSSAGFRNEGSRRKPVILDFLHLLIL